MASEEYNKASIQEVSYRFWSLLILKSTERNPILSSVAMNVPGDPGHSFVWPVATSDLILIQPLQEVDLHSRQ